MKNITKPTNLADSGLSVGKQRNYNEVVEFLDKQWNVPTQPNLQTIKKLDNAFGSLSQKLNTVMVSGSNGKSLTLHFAAILLKSDGLTVGTFYAPHLLTYNERL